MTDVALTAQDFAPQRAAAHEKERESPDSTRVQLDRAASPAPRRRFPKSLRGRKFVPAKRIPEDWEEILALVPPPPPPPVTGGVRVHSIKPRDGEVNAIGLKEPTHRADWTIRRLKVDLKTLQVKYWNVFVPAGQYISSSYFQIGEDMASMRFWPNGYYGKAAKRTRTRMTSGQADSWCAIGLVMPEGTKLKFRFHIGNQMVRSQNVSLASYGVSCGADLDTTSPGAKQPDQSGGGSRDFAGLESQPIGRFNSFTADSQTNCANRKI